MTKPVSAPSTTKPAPNSGRLRNTLASVALMDILEDTNYSAIPVAAEFMVEDAFYRADMILAESATPTA